MKERETIYQDINDTLDFIMRYLDIHQHLEISPQKNFVEKGKKKIFMSISSLKHLSYWKIKMRKYPIRNSVRNIMFVVIF